MLRSQSGEHGARDYGSAERLRSYPRDQLQAPGISAYQAKLIQGSRLIDTEIFSADLDKLPLENPRRILDEGSAPHLSPDGRRLAYFLHKPDSNSVELWLKDLLFQKEWRVSDHIWVQVSDIPLEWMESVVWSMDSSKLYFVEGGEPDGMILKVCTLGADAEGLPPSQKVIESDPKTRISDPTPARDGNSLAYCLMKPGPPPTWEIRRLDLVSRHNQLLFSESGFHGKLYCMGWQESSLLALRSFLPDRRGDNSGKLQILKIEPDGSWNQIGQFERAYGQTAMLDPGGQTLYVTSLENDISNIVACDLSFKKVRRLTDNRRADITFSGLQTDTAGRLFFSQQKHVSDIYLLKFENK